MKIKCNKCNKRHGIYFFEGSAHMGIFCDKCAIKGYNFCMALSPP